MPFLRSRVVTYMNSLAQALLASLSARPAAALLTTPTVHLWTSGPTINEFNTVANFTEATFAGYAAVALPALLGPVNLIPDTIALHGEVDFLAGAVVAPGQAILGYFVSDGTNAILYAAEAFQTPVPIAQAGDFISLDVCLPLLELVPCQ